MSMSLPRFIAGQLRKPSGFIGRALTGRVLNWANTPLNERTLQLLDVQPDDDVLEVGFGGGDLMSRMAAVVTHGRIAGVDFSQEMVEVCRKRFAPLVDAGRIELRCASAESLPYDAERFTKACSVNTIYFWPDPVVALAELRRTLRAGGRLVVSFTPRATAQRMRYTQYDFTLYEADEVQGLLEQAGFREVRLVRGTHRIGEFVCAVCT